MLEHLELEAPVPRSEFARETKDAHWTAAQRSNSVVTLRPDAPGPAGAPPSGSAQRSSKQAKLAALLGMDEELVVNASSRERRPACPAGSPCVTPRPWP